jgi:hypothetical protein
MNSWLVWTVVVLAAVLLGFVGYHFTVRTLRFFTAAFAVAVVVLITRYGVTYPARAPTNLVNAFTRGFDDLSAAFFHPLLLGHHIPVPGKIGWLALIVGLVFGYRELEVWAKRWQPPTLDMSTLGGGQPTTSKNGAPKGPGEENPDKQLHDMLVAELRFRLPAVDVRAPAILPGGTTTTGLASIVENSGVEGSGLAGAILRFVGALWPRPRRYRVRVWLERESHTAGKEASSADRRVTVDLEDPGSGESVATKTLPVRNLYDEASSVVAGYVARHMFKADPTAPPWCHGSLDGSDLAAMLVAGQQKVYPQSPAEVRGSQRGQIKILANCNSLLAGVARYELAHLYDLEGYHTKALWLHARNREQFPRFYRSRYRLAMSLEMIANPYIEHASKPCQDMLRQDSLKESLRILDRCGLTHGAEDMYEAASTQSPARDNSSRNRLKRELLAAAEKELRHCRRQLSLQHVIWGSFWHRDERVMRKPYWRLRDRQHFRDGALVAELLVTVRQILNNEECTHKDYRHAKRAMGIMAAVTGQRKGLNNGECTCKDYRHAKRAMRIMAAVTGCCAGVEMSSTGPESPEQPEQKEEKPTGQSPERTRWLPRQRRTRSWSAAYNTACVYAALADSGRYSKEEMARLVVTSLRYAINDPECELERPSDWISQDPDFFCLRCSSREFNEFLDAQKQNDYPAVSLEPAHH